MKYVLLVAAIATSLLFVKRSEPYEFKGVAMTVPYRILVGQPLNALQIYKTQRKIDAIFDRTHRVYNKWNPESELSKFNQLEAGKSLDISVRLARLLELTHRMWKQTDHLFDPTIEGKVIGWDKVDLYGITLTKKEDIQLDLGGIAKGQTIDELTEELHFANLLVEWGGDFRAKGQHPEGRPWLVSIKNPFGGEIATIPLQDEALATSGDYEQFEFVNGKHLSHIVHPFTGEKLERKSGSVVSCSVLGKTCAEADAMATAGMLLNQNEIWTKDEFSFYFLFAE